MDITFEQGFEQLQAFYAAHGEPKKGGIRENEASLATWMTKLRSNKMKGLKPELCARVECEFPWWRWDPKADALDQTISQLQAFYAAHGEPKKGGVRENEASLANWIVKQRSNKMKGLNRHLSERVECQLPWLSWY
jgi:hypothetical protein